MSDHLHSVRSFLVDINHPLKGGTANAAGMNCMGKVSVSGTTTPPEPGFSLSYIKVAIRSGTTKLTEQDAKNGSTVVNVIPDATDPTLNRWNGVFGPVRCSGTGCAIPDDANVRAFCFYEKIGSAPLEQFTESIDFKAKCVPQAASEVGSYGLPNDVVGSQASAVLGWSDFRLDVNAMDEGNRLMRTPNVALRGDRVECYARFVDWKLNGNPFKAIRSPLGNYRVANVPGFQHENILVLLGTLWVA